MSVSKLLTGYVCENCKACGIWLNYIYYFCVMMRWRLEGHEDILCGPQVSKKKKSGIYLERGNHCCG